MPSKKKRAISHPWRLQIGPGFIVAAAFVGPGTVVTAATAGASFGLNLVWVVLFSASAAMILQEMATRLGTLTGMGLGELLNRQFSKTQARLAVVMLIVVAIGVGNAAYQTGNLTGASMGFQRATSLPFIPIACLVALVVSVLLWLGTYRIVERVLVSSVAVMGAAFVVSAAVTVTTQPLDWSTLRLSIPTGALTTTLALIGTTLVPYNLFLHASASSRRWAPVRPRELGLRHARFDSILGISAGGIVTLSILIVSAASTTNNEATVNNSNLSQVLQNITDQQYAHVFFYLGVAAAGLTSAMTAPLAAAYAICGIQGWSTELSSRPFRAIWISVMLCGLTACITIGASPEQIIIVAQAANAVLLPFIAGILLLACNSKILGRYANSRTTNVAAISVILLVLCLSIYNVTKLL